MKKRQKHKKSAAASSSQAGFILWIFLVVIMLVFYLWGKVQIEFIMRQNDELSREKRMLQQKVSALRITVNRKRRYERIVKEARSLGLNFVAPNRLYELPVSTEELENDVYRKFDQIQYAGWTIIGSK